VTGVSSTSPVPADPVGATVTFYYVPDRTNPGPDSVSLTLTDGRGGTVTATQTITAAAPVNHAPTLTLTPTTNSDGTINLTITIADADSDNVTLTLAAPEHGTYAIGGQTLPGGFTQTAPVGPGGATGTFVYTPDPTRPGVENITFTATDSYGGITTTSTSVTVKPANIAPVTDVPVVGSPDAISGVVTGTVSATDPDGSAVTYSLSIPPSSLYGTASVDASSGAFTFTPDLNALLARLRRQLSRSTRATDQASARLR
jgi:hypothetical protein